MSTTRWCFQICIDDTGTCIILPVTLPTGIVLLHETSLRAFLHANYSVRNNLLYVIRKAMTSATRWYCQICSDDTGTDTRAPETLKMTIWIREYAHCGPSTEFVVMNMTSYDTSSCSPYPCAHCGTNNFPVASRTKKLWAPICRWNFRIVDFRGNSRLSVMGT